MADELYESIYEEAAALRRLVALADAMFAEMRLHQQAEMDASYQIEFGRDGPSVAGALDGADRSYVFHRHQEGRKIGLPKASTALGQDWPAERRQRCAELRDQIITRRLAGMQRILEAATDASGPAQEADRG